jgi:hypothetical protein
MKKFFIFLVLSILLLTPFTITKAQLSNSINNLDNAIGGQNGAGLQRDLATSISTVVKGVLALVGTIFLLLTIYAGILWMTAQGEEAKVGKAIQIIRASVVGLIITMSAYAITYFVTTKVGGGASTANPNNSVNPQTLGCCISRDVPPVCEQNIKLIDCNPNTKSWSQTCPANCKK